MKLNKYIDHTLLKADATTEQIKKLCAEARQYDFASVCVNSCHVSLAKAELDGTDVKVCCVVGFPLGACFTEAKACEAAYPCKLLEGRDQALFVFLFHWKTQ